MRKSFVALIGLALALTACGDGGEDLDTSSWLRPDGDWELVEGVATVDGYPITLSSDGTGVSGRAACNSYSGVAVINGSAVFFGELSQTEMGCEPSVMEAEAAFLTALQRVQNFRFAGDRLVLTGARTDLVFSPVQPVPTSEFIGTNWVLETLIEGETASSVAGEPATLLPAADGTLTASTGCRTHTGSWLANDAAIVVPDFLAEGECPDGLWKQDSLVVTVVGDEFRAEVEGDRLTLTSMGVDGLVYRAEG
jgi:heat shock protein HslJ